jgi:periplasmic protein CpxP/Spy
MELTKIKTLWVAVFVLLLLNITILASIWPFIDLSTLSFRPPRPQNPAAFIIDKLDLDKEQQKVFEGLRQEHFSEMKRLRASIMDDKAAMYKQLKSDAPDTSATYHYISRVMQHEEELQHITFEHFRKVRAICNEEQKRHFDAIIDQVMHMVLRPPHGPGGPGHPGDKHRPLH